VSDPNPPLVRGQFFVVRFEYVRTVHGAEGVRTALSALPSVDQQALEGLEQDSWYPFRTLLRLDRVIASLFAPDDPDIYERIGEASSGFRTDWLGQHAPLVSVHGFLARTAEEHRRHFTFGRSSYRRTGFTQGQMSVSDYPEPDQIFCRSAVGYLRGVLRALTGQPATVEERECQCEGAPACVFAMSWTGSGG
jgi:uncharacterized protein (TIGR02265 family)